VGGMHEVPGVHGAAVQLVGACTRFQGCTVCWRLAVCHRGEHPLACHGSEPATFDSLIGLGLQRFQHAQKNGILDIVVMRNDWILGWSVGNHPRGYSPVRAVVAAPRPSSF
jgi:hypothetical protein